MPAIIKWLTDLIKPMNGNTIIISAGHGGVLDGKYTTSPKSIGKKGSNLGTKCYRHKYQEIHGDGWAYEGVFNREIANRLRYKAEKKGYKVVYVHDDTLDVSFHEKTVRANKINGNCVLIPIHCNAVKSRNGKGFEGFTTKRLNNSDQLADFIYLGLMSKAKSQFPSYKIRSDITDGDFDKEADFYEIKYSKHANTYLEIAFFDNEHDIKLLTNPLFQSLVCDGILNGIDNYFEWKK